MDPVLARRQLVITAVCSALLAAFAFFVAGCASMFNPRQPRAVARVVDNAYRVLAFCDGEMDSVGSGTAVGPRTVITARHVVEACTDGQLVGFVVVDADGAMTPVQRGKVAGGKTTIENEEIDIDAAQLVIIDEWEADFPSWAEIADYDPFLGQRLVYYAGDGSTMSLSLFYFKDGFVSWFDSKSLIVSTHVVPGNSGAGVFDERGRLVAVLWGGVWHPAAENLLVASRVRAFRDIIPKPPKKPPSGDLLDDPTFGP